MSLGLYDARVRRRRSFIWGVVKGIVVLAAMGGLVVFGFDMGVRWNGQEIDRLNADVTLVRNELERVAGERDTALVDADAAAARAADWERRHAEDTAAWEARYAADVPTGDARRLLDLTQARLAEGMEAERIAFLIRSAGTLRTCDPGLITARFPVDVPGGEPGRPLSFADGRLRLVARGERAVSAAGLPENWYDPAEPVEVAVQNLAGETVSHTDILPFTASVLSGGSEYRFRLTADARGFVSVTAERCDYP